VVPVELAQATSPTITTRVGPALAAHARVRAHVGRVRRLLDRHEQMMARM